jgi:hypothetical protein
VNRDRRLVVIDRVPSHAYSDSLYLDNIGVTSGGRSDLIGYVVEDDCDQGGDEAKHGAHD